MGFPAPWVATADNPTGRSRVAQVRLACRELFVRLGDEEVLVLDCRDPSDWERYGAHIPGALWMPFEELLQDLVILPDDELIVVCGCSPDGSDAHRVCRLLQRHGLQVVCLEGGLQGWLTEGLPVEEHYTEAVASQAC
ncbi:rhodanese-like domain-containing protein [Archangium primigenium]|nr:rhodanese-like domain-containing protein [Archangium primigenium]